MLNFIEKTRFKVWWSHLIAPLTFGIYLYFFKENSTNISQYLLFLSGSFLLAFFGYLTNDFFDKNADKKAQKSNFFEDISQQFHKPIIITVFLLSLITWWFVNANQSIKYLIITIEILLFFLYSSNLFRIKENSFAGILFDSLYGHVFPWLMLLIVFPISNSLHLLIPVLLWQFFLGIRNILQHQLNDFENDIKSNTATFVTKNGAAHTSNITDKTVVFELVFLIITLIIWYNIIGTSFLLPLGVAFIFFAIHFFSNYKSIPIVLKDELNVLYEYILPFSFGLALSVYTSSFIFLFHLFLFFAGSKFIYSKFVHLYSKVSFSKVKLLGNYVIYYAFRIFRIDLKKENMTAKEYLKNLFNTK